MPTFDLVGSAVARRSTTRASAALGAAALAAVGAAAYLRWVRPWHLAWGATEDERRRPMPGDAEVPEPHLDATRAISIAAPPAAVWPWLLQMGYRRAGFYSYRFDNAWVASPWRIVPELQRVEVGDIMPTGPGEGFTVKAMDRPRSLLLVIEEEAIHVSSSIVLEEVGESGTRMIGRLRVRFGRGLPLFLYRLLFDLGDFIMMRRMFLGIKERAEFLVGSASGSSAPSSGSRTQRAGGCLLRGHVSKQKRLPRAAASPTATSSAAQGEDRRLRASRPGSLAGASPGASPSASRDASRAEAQRASSRSASRKGR